MFRLVNDDENEAQYTINLKNGEYTFEDVLETKSGSYNKTVTINGEEVLLRALL